MPCIVILSITIYYCFSLGANADPLALAEIFPISDPNNRKLMLVTFLTKFTHAVRGQQQLKLPKRFINVKIFKDLQSKNIQQIANVFSF